MGIKTVPEQKILICWPVSFPGYVVPGSLPMKCRECDKPVWVSPASMLLLHDNPEMTILCEPCVFAHMATHEGTIDALTPAQIEEIEEFKRGEGGRWP